MPDGSVHVVIPYSPRGIFQPFHERKQRWSITVAHRRAGKTVARINELIRAALICPHREPHMAYIAPTYAQAKDVAWLYLKHYCAPIPGVKSNEAELHVTLPNGGRVRLYGAENYDRIRGVYLDGVVLDEYGQMEPRAWPEVIRPALSDRGGWADFIGTPNGRNHFCEMWEKADAEWYKAIHKASETKIIPESELADAKKQMSADQYEQEYECSFQAAVVGAYYGRELTAAEADKRIRAIPYDPAVPVQTWWDLGIDDSTAIWFVQAVNREVRCIDYYENSGVGLDHYAKVLQGKPYVYGDHILPHDAEVKELGTGKSRVETLAGLGIKVRVARRLGIEDGINAARLLLGRTWFDGEKCKRGIEALRQYRKEFDEKLKAFKNRPLHDWTSHAADAFRYGAVEIDERPASKPIKYPSYGLA